MKKKLAISAAILIILCLCSCGMIPAVEYEEELITDEPVAEQTSEIPEITEAEETEENAVSEISPETEPIPETEQESEPEPEPEPLPDAYQLDTVVRYNDRYAGSLSDDSYYTYLTTEAESTVSVTAEEDIYSLYIIWEVVPAEWKIISGDCEADCSDLRYIHQYVELANPSACVEIITGAEYGKMCDVYAFSYGNVPSWVQKWKQAETVDIMLFPTHSDDEVLFMGGIMPKYIDMGYEIQVVYMTTHTLAERKHERLNGLWTLGVDNYPEINPQLDVNCDNFYRALYHYGEENFTGFQVEMIRKYHPLVVVGHGEDGEYGHGAHLLNTYCLQNAVVAAADEEQYPDSAGLYGTWDTPKLYLHDTGDKITTLDYETPLESFGGKTAFELAEEAFECHYSQHGMGLYVNDTGDTHDSHRFGLYRSLVGDDIECNDLLENINIADYR